MGERTGQFNERSRRRARRAPFLCSELVDLDPVLAGPYRRQTGDDRAARSLGLVLGHNPQKGAPLSAGFESGGTGKGGDWVWEVARQALSQARAQPALRDVGVVGMS